jgi:hypothetical protein
MRARNREVNIFNMSLLDILCGALGAFCFMMLSLFPYQAKVKELQKLLDKAEANSGVGMQEKLDAANKRADDAEKEADKAKAEQSLLYMQIFWRGGQDIDIWIESPSGRVFTPKQQLVPQEKRAGNTADEKKGPTKEVVWFSDVAYSGNEYRMFARLAATNGDTSPAQVHGYITGRVPAADDQHSVMGLYDLGTYTFTQEGERLELGSVVFSKGDFSVTYGPKNASNGSTPPPQP